MLPDFDLLRPSALPEALALLAESDVLPIAGGTNVIADLRAGKHAPRALLDVTRLAQLRDIHRENGHVVMGGRTTITDLIEHPLLAPATALRQAARMFANPLIRNRATVGGNLADASPAADTAPPLLALGAEVELTSHRGTRRVPLAEFLVGVRRTVRQPDELITAISWPAPGENSASAFYKVGLRKADAISVLSAAVAVEFDDAGCCTSARIALGAVAPRPIRMAPAEAVLLGEKMTPAAIVEAARLAGEGISPISDIRGSASYRRQVTEVVVRRLLTQVATRSQS